MPPQANDFVSVLQLTDTHILATPQSTLLGVNTAAYFDAIVDLAATSGKAFDLCLMTGDLAQDPLPESYRYILNRMQPMPFPTVCLPGNHDDLGIMQQVLQHEPVSCLKQVVLGNWQVVCLSSQIEGSADGYLADEELAFVERCLTMHPNHYALIALHHNCIPTGSEWMDTMIVGNSQAFFDILGNYNKVRAIVNGHIHQEVDVVHRGIRILSTPSTCFQFKPNNKRFGLDDTSPGYRWLNLCNDGTIDTGVVRPFGQNRRHPNGFKRLLNAIAKPGVFGEFSRQIAAGINRDARRGQDFAQFRHRPLINLALENKRHRGAVPNNRPNASRQIRAWGNGRSGRWTRAKPSAT